MLHMMPYMIRGNAVQQHCHELQQQVQPEPHSDQCAVHTVVTL